MSQNVVLLVFSHMAQCNKFSNCFVSVSPSTSDLKFLLSDINDTSPDHPRSVKLIDFKGLKLADKVDVRKPKTHHGNISVKKLPQICKNGEPQLDLFQSLYDFFPEIRN